MLKIGLTGGIGSGKSTVATYFAELGIAVIDADAIARELLAPHSSNQPLITTIVKHFGSAILTKTNEIDRTKLREIIFANDTQRAWLENLLHPLIRTEIKHRLQTIQTNYCILVIPLLLEKNMQDWVDRILVVHASEDLQVKRIKKRDKTEHAQINAILDAQMSDQQRLKQANDIIHNNGTLAELKQKVTELHAYYLTLEHHYAHHKNH